MLDETAGAAAPGVEAEVCPPNKPPPELACGCNELPKLRGDCARTSRVVKLDRIQPTNTDKNIRFIAVSSREKPNNCFHRLDR